MVKYFSAFFVCWHFVKLKIFLFPGPQFRIGVMSAVRDGKSYLRWDRPDTLLHWWQLLGWGGDTLGLWSKIFFYEELYKRTGWQWKGDSWCWQQQIQKVFPEILSIFNLKRPILLILTLPGVRIDRLEMSRELWEKLDPMALYGAHLARLKLTWTKQFTILRGTVKDCLLGLNCLV